MNPLPGRRLGTNTVRWRRLTAATALVAATALGVVVLDDSGASALLVERFHRGSSAPAGITAADGYIGGRIVTADDVREPAVAHLDPALRTALSRASADAARHGVALHVNSGWRSRAYQRALLRQAVERYGSVREARRWVRTPDSSTHVSGRAVDVGPAAAARWLQTHGSRYGLCRVYANERRHFELLVPPGARCPALLPDAAG